MTSKMTSPEIHSSWKQEWNDEAYFNDATSNSAGVAIMLKLNSDYKVLKYSQDEQGRLQIMSLLLENELFLVVNIYNNNQEKDQISLLNKLNNELESFDDLEHHKVIIAGDFNFIYDTTMDAKGGNPSLKMKSLDAIIRIREKYDLCDIFRIRHPKSKIYTFRTSNRKLHRRLDHILVSNIIQESIKSVSILPSVRSDHSPILISVQPLDNKKTGPGIWKFNNSLLQNDAFCTALDSKIEEVLDNMGNTTDKQFIWEILKFEIRCCCIRFSKKNAKEVRAKKVKLESIVKDYESRACPTNKEDEYLAARLELDQMLDRVAKGYILRAKCQVYEGGDKSTKYFLSLE
jgi:exonuclease III